MDDAVAQTATDSSIEHGDERSDPMRVVGYLDPNSRLTLREGLAEYRAANVGEGFFEESELRQEARALFHNHDRVHVVFGLTTDVRHEVLADSWTLLGADIPWRDYLAYIREPAARKAIENIGTCHALWVSLLTLPDIVRVYFRSRAMTKMWPWADHESFLDVPLVELRQEFGIRLLA